MSSGCLLSRSSSRSRNTRLTCSPRTRTLKTHSMPPWRCRRGYIWIERKGRECDQSSPKSHPGSFCVNNRQGNHKIMLFICEADHLYFVCAGNTCRSATMDMIAKSILTCWGVDESVLKIGSFAARGKPNKPAHPLTRRALRSSVFVDYFHRYIDCQSKETAARILAKHAGEFRTDVPDVCSFYLLAQLKSHACAWIAAQYIPDDGAMLTCSRFRLKAAVYSSTMFRFLGGATLQLVSVVERSQKDVRSCCFPPTVWFSVSAHFQGFVIEP